MKNLEIHEVLSKARLGRRRPCSWTDQKIVQILRSAFPLTFCPAIFVEYSAQSQSIYLQFALPTKWIRGFWCANRCLLLTQKTVSELDKMFWVNEKRSVSAIEIIWNELLEKQGLKDEVQCSDWVWIRIVVYGRISLSESSAGSKAVNSKPVTHTMDRPFISWVVCTRYKSLQKCYKRSHIMRVNHNVRKRL